MQTAQEDGVRERERAQVHHGNSGRGDGAFRIAGNNRVAVGVFLEVAQDSNPTGLVGDVGGAAIAREHDAVRDVTDTNFPNLHRGVLGQVDLGQRIVVVQHGIGGVVIRGDRNPEGVGTRYPVRLKCDGLAAGDEDAARGSPRAVREAGDVGQIALSIDVHRH